MTTTTFVAHAGAMDTWWEERRARGLDRRDEVWEGVYHVVPHAAASHGALSHRLGQALAARAAERGLVTLGEFNLGRPDDYRVPDMGWVSTVGALDDLGLYLRTVDVVVEMRSEGDETDAKVPFYLERGVREVWVVTPAARCVSISTPDDPQGLAVRASAVLGVAVEEVLEALGWRA